MSPTIRRTVRAYVDRRTPWGPPWWVYAVALGAANLVRQALLWGSDPGTAVDVASFLAMVAIVFGTVTGVAVLLRRHERRHLSDPPAGGPEQLTLWTADCRS